MTRGAGANDWESVEWGRETERAPDSDYLNPKLNLGTDGGVANTGWGSADIGIGLRAMGVAGGGASRDTKGAARRPGGCSCSSSVDVSSRRCRRKAMRNSCAQTPGRQYHLGDSGNATYLGTMPLEPRLRTNRLQLVLQRGGCRHGVLCSCDGREEVHLDCVRRGLVSCEVRVETQLLFPTRTTTTTTPP